MNKSDIMPRHAKLPEGCATTAENLDMNLPIALSHELPMASSATPVVELVSYRALYVQRELMSRTCQV